MHKLSSLIKVFKRIKLKGRNRFLISVRLNGWYFLVVVKMAEVLFYGWDHFVVFYEI
jgi:hypothetical protein